MKRMKKLIALLLALVMCVGVLAGCSSGSSENSQAPASEKPSADVADPSTAPAEEWPENPSKVYSLSVGVTIAQNTPSGKALLAIKDELEKRSNGAVTLDIYWESTLGGASEIAEGVMTGSMDIGLVSSAIISNYTSAIDVLSLPFMIQNREHMKAVIDSCFDDITAGMEETIGIPLGIWEFGYRHLCTRDKEVKTLEDCAGLTIRVMDGQIYTATFNALGCIPTNVATSELVTALQQGMVDGVEEPFSMICGQQQYTFCKYVAMIGYNYSAGCPVMSAMTADSLPENVLALVEEVFHDYRYYTVDMGQGAEDDYIKTCEDAGMVINYLDAEELARFQEAVAPIWEEYADRIGSDLIEKVSTTAY